ncbi:MAG: polymer-forming cytoskeletal protein [Treponema sp.]|nr:polymer-forming cytoskeletal protein [Spirochaetia bacterium]MDD6295958.1 polymer-forming cytoskeletal protein [Treponema sp.]MDD7450089.1 polymer-forming cytoskeletal protein [Treponema sp.]MDY2923539.1 polymer-forming cytoskeletal protein [Treponema sp.]MDY5682839.1 polymer-forming cytoskeletal protein [Treponema sp.]
MEPKKRNLTVFGPETEFDGDLEYSDDLVITGKFSGNIKSNGSLEIARTAVCKVGKISVQSIVIFGTVIGDIEASERIEMCAGSKVSGDVSTARLRIAENVDFDGQVTMLDEIPSVDLFSVASREYKQALVLKSDFVQ